MMDVINAAALALVGAALAPKSPAENWLVTTAASTKQERPRTQGKPKPEFGYAIIPPATKKTRVVVPDGITTLYLIDGSPLLVPEDRVVEYPRKTPSRSECVAGRGSRPNPKQPSMSLQGNGFHSDHETCALILEASIRSL